MAGHVIVVVVCETQSDALGTRVQAEASNPAHAAYSAPGDERSAPRFDEFDKAVQGLRDIFAFDFFLSLRTEAAAAPLPKATSCSGFCIAVAGAW